MGLRQRIVLSVCAVKVVVLIVLLRLNCVRTYVSWICSILFVNFFRGNSVSFLLNLFRFSQFLGCY